MIANSIAALCLPVESTGPAADEDEFPYIDLSAVDARTKSIVKPRLVQRAEAPSRARQRVRAGDILVSTVRPNLNGVAQVPPSLDGAIASTGFTVLRINQDLADDRYVFHWVQSIRFVTDMVRQSTGASYPAVSDRIVKASQLPAPPLPEQRRIASILDQAAHVASLRALVKEQAARTRVALFDSLFSRGYLAGIQNRFLADVTLKITDGTHHSPAIQSEGVPYVTAKHLKRDGLRFEADPWFISEEDHRKIYSRCNPRPGDVLYIKDGATTGIAAVNRYEFEFSMLSSLALIRPDTEVLRPGYLAAWLSHPTTLSSALRQVSGAAITRLTLAKIKQFIVPCPPLEEQVVFEEALGGIDANAMLGEAHQRLASELMGSLQARAFRGEL